MWLVHKWETTETVLRSFDSNGAPIKQLQEKIILDQRLHLMCTVYTFHTKQPPGETLKLLHFDN